MSTLRLPGQSALPVPGAVVRDGVMYTSGLVAPSALTDSPGVAADQIADALAALLGVLKSGGSAPEAVLRLECFLANGDDFAEWNRQYAEIWPTPGPARTTLVSLFANPSILIEIQAIAAVDS